MRAEAISPVPLEADIAFKAAWSALLSPEIEAKAWGEGPAEMIVMRLSLPRLSTSAPASSLARSKRLSPPASSVACIEAEASSTTTILPEAIASVKIKGRARLKTSRRRRRSCRRSSKLRRSRCQGALAVRSSKARRHSIDDETFSSSRRSRSI